MKPELAEILLCPAPDCGGDLALEVAESDQASGEVRIGKLICARCSRVYPINDYVPSFTALFPEKLKAEADYWDSWYGRMWDMGRLGMFDVRQPVAPYSHLGVAVPAPVIGSPDAVAGTLAQLAEDPLLQGPHRLLDVGCGGGWSSLYLARMDHRVVAFDPSEQNMRRAKAYAMQAAPGADLDYIAAALGYLRFKEGVFDGVTCMHSLHHVPEVARELDRINDWLAPGGVLALDEHLGTDPVLGCVMAELNNWFNEKVAPRYAQAGESPSKHEASSESSGAVGSLSSHDLVSTEEQASTAGTLCAPEPSPLEDAGAADWLEAVCSRFAVQWASTRFVGLDQFSYMYYLHKNMDQEALLWASKGVSALYDMLAEIWPERVEYVTLLARKPGQDEPSADSQELPEALKYLLKSGGGEDRTLYLDRVIQEKNSHIESLEENLGQAHDAWAEATADQARMRELLARIEEGKAMRALRAFDRVRSRFPRPARKKPSKRR